MITLILLKNFSYAKYTSSLNVPFVRGKVNYKHPDFKVMAMFVQASSGSTTYNEIDKMPSGEEYVINEVKSYCNKGFTEEKDDKIVLKTVDGNHVMNNLTKNDRCTLYFDVAPLTVPKILAKYIKDNSRSGEITANFTGSTPTTVYSKEDDDGTSYVFAGASPNNWIKMGNTYYRIIRFNGNGSMRLIVDVQIGTKEFDLDGNVGLQYTENEIHGKSTNSTILGDISSSDSTTLYGWYNNNIKDIYGNLIDISAGFCSDRTIIQNFYAPGYRYPAGSSASTYYTPTLKCENSSDLLKLPVGLITADEYMLAGGVNVGAGIFNTIIWLHAVEPYWTMSPYFGNYVFYVWHDGYMDNDSSVRIMRGVRPVINLKSTTIFENNNADGSAEKPYVVKVQ